MISVQCETQPPAASTASRVNDDSSMSHHDLMTEDWFSSLFGSVQCWVAGWLANHTVHMLWGHACYK